MSSERRVKTGQCLLFTLLLLIGQAVWVADLSAAIQDLSPGDITRGTLLLRDVRGASPAPTLMTEVTIEATALLARVRVEQRFRNPGTGWTEAVYVFPLPEDAAVDRLRMRVGERIVEGRIKEREEAKQDYLTAREEGRKASLVEQERPNIFTATVANIGPGEEVAVHIEYQQSVAYGDGNFRLRFPLVIGPRYIPGTPQPALREKISLSHGWASDTDRVPDASRITPPVAYPDEDLSNPVSIRVRLDPGVDLDSVVSSYHRIQSVKDGNVHSIRLAQQKVPADRDFELVWRPTQGNEPRAALFTERTEAGSYGLLMIVPPGKEVLERLSVARDLTLVIDTSGSMHGASIAQAKTAVHLALGALKSDDRFNLIRFDNMTSSLHRTPQASTTAALRLAHRWVDDLEANGGTEMAPALRRALAADAESSGRLSQVVFITDGAVGNEEELFRLIHDNLGETRLFTVGIGSAPNSFFMRKAARFGRGSFTYIGKPQEAAQKMGTLLQRLEYPALTDIRIDLGTTDPEAMFPDPVPDLYPGEPLMVAMRFEQMPQTVSVQGRFGSRPWQSEITIQEPEDSNGVAVLWARRKIEQLMEQHAMAREQKHQQSVRTRVIATALTHHLVSRYTSLVAVDVTPSRPREQSADSQAVKTNLPHGWTYEKVFGMPKTATPAMLYVALGLLMLAAGWFVSGRCRA